MEKRPKIRPPATGADTLMETLGWLLLAALWGFVIVYYPTLPETIPTHFNASGQADGFGNKTSVFFMPGIFTLLFAGLTLMNRYPYLFNYPVKITIENATEKYTLASRMIRCLKISLVVVAGLVAFHTIRMANGQASLPEGWLLPAILGVILIPMLIFIVKLAGKK